VVLLAIFSVLYTGARKDLAQKAAQQEQKAADQKAADQKHKDEVDAKANADAKNARTNAKPPILAKERKKES